MRGEWILKALDILENVAYTTADFLEDFAASTKSDYRSLHNLTPRYRKTVASKLLDELKEEQAVREKIYHLLYRLEKDGLIFKSGSKRTGVWSITTKGNKKKEMLRKLVSNFFPLPNSYKSEKTNCPVIVCFDIPEKEKKKRFWLRSVLKNLGLYMLQKSVWIGKIKIPVNLIRDLQKLNLIDCVEIFAVTKSGTIRHIV